jgi:hypothetical protein
MMYRACATEPSRCRLYLLPSLQEKERMNPGASGLFAAQSLSVWRQTQPGAPHG